MKKKILGKLTLEKRSVATLSHDNMATLNGGGYTSAGTDCIGRCNVNAVSNFLTQCYCVISTPYAGCK